MTNILVTNKNFDEVDSILETKVFLSLDTETYGLRFKDNLFSIQISDGVNNYYLDYKTFEHAKFRIYNKKQVTWFIHNAKFDLMMLRKKAIELAGRVHCTQAIERLIYNCYLRYSLDACLKRMGRSKHDGVKDWIAKNKAYSWITTKGKKKRTKVPHYDRVPFDLMFEYGCQDARDCYDLGISQINKLTDADIPLYENECELTKTCFEMEWEGIKIDSNYTKEGMEYEEKEREKSVKQLEILVGRSYESGPIWLSKTLKDSGIKFSTDPETGNPIFDKTALRKIDNPICKEIIKIRNHEKYAGTYYASFLQLSDENCVIHASIQQAGTETGRFSYWDPNLQNVPKEDKGSFAYYVRKCFIPRDGFFFAMLDYDQVEYRVLADYAGETDLISRIMSGVDVHQATADMMGIDRKVAKTINFLLLYGGGPAKLASTLGIDISTAKQYRELYFSKLPKIKSFMDKVQQRARSRGHIFNKYGRKYQYEGIVKLKDGGYFDPAYRLVNSLIQGTCADIMKFAMVKISKEIKPFKSKMLITVHDELVNEIHKTELPVIQTIKNIMENTYEPFNGIKLTVGCEYSNISWGRCDILEGVPSEDQLLSV